MEATALDEYFEDFDLDCFTDEALEKLAEIKNGVLEDEEELLEWIQEHDEKGAFLIYERLEHYIVQNTLFFTKEEAKNHLKSNGHHYTKDAHTYAQTAIRSPEINRLLQILETFDWNSLEMKEPAKKG